MLFVYVFTPIWFTCFTPCHQLTKTRVHSFCLFIWHTSYNQYKHDEERSRGFGEIYWGGTCLTQTNCSGSWFIPAAWKPWIRRKWEMSSGSMWYKHILFFAEFTGANIHDFVITSNLCRKCHPLCAGTGGSDSGVCQGALGHSLLATHPHQIEFMSWDRKQRQCHPELCLCSLIHHLQQNILGQAVHRELLSENTWCFAM